jgi:hypothetical protein
MPNRDLDFMIHMYVMGRSLHDVCDGETGEQPNSSDGWYCLKCGYQGHWGSGGYEHIEVPPLYSTDISVAWMVVDRIVAIGGAVWERFDAHAEKDLGRLWALSGESVARVICLISLKAVFPIENDETGGLS